MMVTDRIQGDDWEDTMTVVYYDGVSQMTVGVALEAPQSLLQVQINGVEEGEYGNTT